MDCTWKDCKNEAVKSLKDKNGKIWARLCKSHHKEHEEAFDINKNNRKE